MSSVSSGFRNSVLAFKLVRKYSVLGFSSGLRNLRSVFAFQRVEKLAGSSLSSGLTNLHSVFAFQRVKKLAQCLHFPAG